MFTENYREILDFLFALSTIIVAGALGAIFVQKFNQALVLGELGAGIVIGNASLFGSQYFLPIFHEQSLQNLAQLGSIILLFEIGLVSKFELIFKLGLRSLLLALTGLILPMISIYYVSGFLWPDLMPLTKIFLAASFAATSISIGAKVFQELNYINSKEAQMVLGASIIDDILGLIIFGLVASLAHKQSSNFIELGFNAATSIAILAFAFLLAFFFAKHGIKNLSVFKIPGIKLVSVLMICFTGAYLAGLLGLAPIVGAFAAGLILEEVYFQDFETKTSVEDLIKPISLFLTPIFFVLSGVDVDLTVFADFEILFKALVLALIAILTKVICGFVVGENSRKSMIIGLAMAARGEVALIFASMGKAFGLIDDKIFAITIFVIMLTNLVPTIWLKPLINKC